MIRLATLALLALTASAAVAVADPGGRALPFVDRFAALAGIAEPAQRPVGPALKPAATIVGEIVRIGDLIDNAGALAHVAIFRAPDLGETGSVSVERVLEAVAPHGIAGLDTGGLTDVAVTRASHAVAPADIEARLLGALAARQRLADTSNLTLTFDGELRTLHLNPGADPRIARLTYDARSGRFDAIIELPGSAHKFARFTGTFAETFETVTLTRPLAAGEVLKTSDLTTVRRPKAEFSANIVTDADKALGRAARHAMRPGQVLRHNDLMKPEVIARNDNVTITYEVPGIMLTLMGKAMEGGAKGDLISVLNVVTKKTIQASVAGPGHVVVAAPARITVAPAPAPRLAVNAAARANVNPNALPSAQ